jgi:hypothetical protein
MHFREHAQAADAAARIDSQIFEVELRPSVEEPGWMLRPIYRSFPTPDAHEAAQRSFEAFASRHGGALRGFTCWS